MLPGMSNVPNLAELQNLDHLVPDAELAEKATKKRESSDPEKKEDAAETKEIEPIHFEYTARNGKVWKGEFVNKVLSIAQRQDKAILESQFNGGQPYDSLNGVQATVNHALAHMAYSLQQRPKWAENLRILHDHYVILALCAEVTAHEDKFLGRQSNPEESQEQTK